MVSTLKEVDKMNDIERLCQQYGFKPYLGVLCGWEWAARHQDPLPPVEFETTQGGVRHRMIIKDHNSISRILKAAR